MADSVNVLFVHDPLLTTISDHETFLFEEMFLQYYMLSDLCNRFKSSSILQSATCLQRIKSVNGNTEMLRILDVIERL